MTDKKTNEIRDTTAAAPRQAMLILHRSRTTFLIALHYAEKGTETLEDKVKKMIRRDVQNDDF